MLELIQELARNFTKPKHPSRHRYECDPMKRVKEGRDHSMRPLHREGGIYHLGMGPSIYKTS